MTVPDGPKPLECERQVLLKSVSCIHGRMTWASRASDGGAEQWLLAETRQVLQERGGGRSFDKSISFLSVLIRPLMRLHGTSSFTL